MNKDKSKEPIIIALSTSNNFVPGLIATMTSLILATDRCQRLDFHILDLNINVKTKERAIEFFTIYPNVTVSFHPADVSVFDRAGAGVFGTLGGWSTYASILLHKIIPYDKCIYIDTDFLVLKDIRDVWAIEIDGFAFAAALNTSKGGMKNADRLDAHVKFETVEDLSVFPCLNAGFQIMNLKFWREFKFDEKALEMCKKYGKWIHGNQIIYNYIFRGKTKTLPSEWNYTPWWTRPVLRNVNYHFTSEYKPWASRFFLPAERIWWAMYDNHIKPRWDVAKENRKKTKELLVWLIENGIPCLAPDLYVFIARTITGKNPHPRQNQIGALKEMRKILFRGPDSESKEVISHYIKLFKEIR